MPRTAAKVVETDGAKLIHLGGQTPTNGAKDTIEASMPYIATVTIVGTAAFLYHRWNVESVAAKSTAAKGSAAKKSDDIESYLYFVEDDKKKGLAIPGEQLRMALVNAAKYRQDPRSPRKSAMDLYKAGVVVLTEYAPVGKMTYDYLDKRRVMVQRNGITRTRPALKTGWSATFDVSILLPEYIGHDDLHDVLNNAGKLCGLGDHRPTYGRFRATEFRVRPV